MEQWERNQTCCHKQVWARLKSVARSVCVCVCEGELEGGIGGVLARQVDVVLHIPGVSFAGGSSLSGLG